VSDGVSVCGRANHEETWSDSRVILPSRMSRPFGEVMVRNHLLTVALVVQGK
jgi:hypothetical protein